MSFLCWKKYLRQISEFPFETLYTELELEFLVTKNTLGCVKIGKQCSLLVTRVQNQPS
jgi:hypothetical protein